MIDKTLYSIIGNSQQLDGGAMFGHVPKALWSTWVEPDEHNRIPLACRCLLIKESTRNILLETGVGAFFSPALKDRYGVREDEHVLLNSLKATNTAPEDIDIVILSHLHFDHAGGLLSTYKANQASTLIFPNATFLTSETAWKRASNPHFRDKASFIPELNQLLAASGKLILTNETHHPLLGNDYSFHFSSGHTPGMLLTEVKLTHESSLLFCADLIPGQPWVHLPITMGYDRAAEKLIDEKYDLLNYAVENNVMLFYTHDPKYAVSHVAQNEKGKFYSTGSLTELNPYHP